MAGATFAVALLSGLLLQVGAQPQKVGAQPQLQEKWFWDDLGSLQSQVEESIKRGTEEVKRQTDSLKQNVQDGIKRGTDEAKRQTDSLKQNVQDGIKRGTDEAKRQSENLKRRVREKRDELTEGIESYKQSVRDYTEALKDRTFRMALNSTGLCERLPEAEKDSVDDIEEKMPDPMSKVDIDPEHTEACEAVADKVTAENLKDKIDQNDTDVTVNKFMKLVTQRSAAALCAGEHGMKEWFKEHAHLRDVDPAAYKEKLEEKLKGKVSPILDRFTSQFCSGEEGAEDERLFAVGNGPLAAVGSRGPAVAGALAVFGAALFGLAALLVRRTIRQPQAQELERLAPEDMAEGGMVQ